MQHVLPSWPLLSAFLVASFVLAVTPGPGVFYIVTRSVMQGRRHGIASVLGVALGNLGNAVGASIGLAALFAISTLAFTAVKYAGALYLVYLGIQTLRATGADRDDRSCARAAVAHLSRWFRGCAAEPEDRDFLCRFLAAVHQCRRVTDRA